MELFKKGVEPGDVRQGKLANCYFLSTLAAMAETPGRIESLFNTKTVNAAGIYSLNFYINGVRQEVIVDDWIPCDSKSKLPCFAYSADIGEIWAMLAEKAWAKLHGSYSMVRRGSCITAMPHLTGAPALRFDHNLLEDMEQFWRMLSDSAQRSYICTGSTYENDFNEASAGSPAKKRSSTIISGHSYSILSVHQVKSQGSKVKLVKLRNPHGMGIEWDGDWSDNSDKWTPKLRKDCGSEVDTNDGTFFMALPDYVENFRCTCINFESLSAKTNTLEHDFDIQDRDDE